MPQYYTNEKGPYLMEQHRYTLSQWKALVLPLTVKTKQRGQSKLPKLPAKKITWVVTLEGRAKPVKVKAFTRSEARAELKKLIGKIPVGTKLRKA